VKDSTDGLFIELNSENQDQKLEMARRLTESYLTSHDFAQPSGVCSLETLCYAHPQWPSLIRDQINPIFEYIGT
jgi:hypothetical protein